ncbi:MAG: glycosyltransferase family 1 protein [Planctomycetes bacterium]|nr:glycosyltransferase family 1 protein [Planctomycetota bacterium]
MKMSPNYSKQKSMPTIALEMERIRNQHSGLGQYCLQLGHAFAASPHSWGLGFACLVPQDSVGVFGNSMTYKAVKAWHKIIPPSFAEKIAVWHCMHQDSFYMPPSRKTPLAITIHDLNLLDREDYSAAKKSRRAAAMQQKISRASGLIYISNFVREWVNDHLKVRAGIVEKVIYNGGTLANKMPRPQNLLSTHQNPFLFSIGINPKKNYHVLMPILKQFPEYNWVIAGPDGRGYRSKIEQEAAKLGVTDRIEFCGVISEEAKRDYYENCSALLFPSLSEGFGLPVIEAMSLGKPVFISNRTSLPEIGGREAYYFTDFDSETLISTFAAGMKDYKNDRDKPTRIKAWASQFTWEKAAAQYLEFYQEMLSAG